MRVDEIKLYTFTTVLLVICGGQFDSYYWMSQLDRQRVVFSPNISRYASRGRHFGFIAGYMHDD